MSKQMNKDAEIVFSALLFGLDNGVPRDELKTIFIESIEAGFVQEVTAAVKEERESHLEDWTNGHNSAVAAMQDQLDDAVKTEQKAIADMADAAAEMLNKPGSSMVGCLALRTLAIEIRARMRGQS